MITVTPQGKTLNVASTSGVTYIAPLNPNYNGSFVACIPESSPRSQFTATDLLDGTGADEYLMFDCDHAILSYDMTTMKYEGVVVRLTGNDVNRFEIVKSLSHADCVARNVNNTINGGKDYWTYAGLCNVSKSEELRRAKYYATYANAVVS